MSKPLSERLARGARVMRDTAQMKTQHPEWLLNEMEQSADLLEEAAAALEAAREDGFMQRFADMLLAGLNDIQDALGFTDEDKLCANGSMEIVAEIRALREDAERLDWLAEGFRTCTVYMSGSHAWFPGHKVRSLHGPNFRAAIDQARGKGVAG